MTAKPRTEAELLEWGQTEDATRKAELAGVRSSDDLQRVQRAARKRRNAAGLSAGQAVYAVQLAQRAAREVRR